MPLFELVYLVLPAYFANMAAPFARLWPGWNRPINERWLGSHKTVVGFSFGVAASVLTAYAQSALPWSPRGIDYSAWLAIGFAQGVGAMTGDAVKSFFKRRRRIAPGERWIPADQLDFIIGALLLASPWLTFGVVDVLALLAITFVAHITANHIAFALGIRDTKW